MSSKVPSRFLGYAFCVGDLLLEMDREFCISNADGAVKTTLGSLPLSEKKMNFMDLLDIKGRGVFKRTVDRLSGSNRIGPFDLNVGVLTDGKEKFSAFVAKLPTEPDSIYVVLSRRQRIGTEENAPTPAAQMEEKKQRFFENLEKLFEADPELEDKLQVTVVEADDGQDLNTGQQANIEDYLSSISYAGKSASRVSDGKFAVVHEKSDDSTSADTIRDAVQQATGVSIGTATIDAASSNLSNKDSMKALVFSLQQFADDSDGFDVAAIEDNCETLIGETTERVKAFRKVLAEGAFSLVYQPIVHMKKQSTHHYEALTRFDLPDIMKSQWEMIRFAEDVGLIDDFDRAVVKRVIKKIRELQVQGGAPAIAVNLSGRSLSDPAFVQDLLKILEENRDISHFLSLEITESAKIMDLKSLGTSVQNIRGLGFKVYLDDFGAGAAGFQYLKSLKVDAVKIDGAYIKDALESREDRAFLRSMVMLCRELEIETVGEWIETKDHADLLKDIGVDYGQGYFYGKPTNGLMPSRTVRSA